MDSRVLPLQSWNQMDPIPYKARDIHRDQCRNFSFFKDAPILIRQISIPFQLTNFSDQELKKFEDFIQEVSKMNTKKHLFYSNVNPGQRNGPYNIYIDFFNHAWVMQKYHAAWPQMISVSKARLKYFPSKTFSTWCQRYLSFIFLLGHYLFDIHYKSWFEIGFSHGERFSGRRTNRTSGTKSGLTLYLGSRLGTYLPSSNINMDYTEI